MITSINVASLINHENNPRKDVGDLTELRDSIKKNGILQPLTVVPCGDMYKVVIGHRRLAAAIQAELEEVPCDVQNLSEEEQLNVMMMENMLRENLTTYEEAKGFQLMLDLGKTVEQVAEETGFSQSTVRNRTKLLSLDEKKFIKSVERGATLADLSKLYEIEDEHTRNAVLASAGTNNFESKLNQAIEEERRTKAYEAGKRSIESWATKVTKAELPNPHVYFAGFNKWSSKAPEKTDDREYFFTEEDDRVYIYAKGEDTAEAERKARFEREEAIAAELREAARSCYNLRLNFIRNFGNFRKYGKLIMSAYIKAALEDMTRTTYRSLNLEDVGTVLGIENPTVEDIAELPIEKVCLAMLMAYSDKPTACTWDQHWREQTWVYTYEPNDKLGAWYQFLLSIGYHVSEEEVLMLDGNVNHVIKEVA